MHTVPTNLATAVSTDECLTIANRHRHIFSEDLKRSVTVNCFAPENRPWNLHIYVRAHWSYSQLRRRVPIVEQPVISRVVQQNLRNSSAIRGAHTCTCLRGPVWHKQTTLNSGLNCYTSRASVHLPFCRHR